MNILTALWTCASCGGELHLVRGCTADIPPTLDHVECHNCDAEQPAYEPRDEEEGCEDLR